MPSLSVLGVRFLLSQFCLERELSWAAKEKAVPTSPQELLAMLGAGDSEMNQPLPSKRRVWPRLTGHRHRLPPSQSDMTRSSPAETVGCVISFSLLGGLGPLLSFWNRPSP